MKIGEYFIENIDVSGSKAGNIYIRGGKFAIDKGTIKANTRGDENGGGIDVRLTGDLLVTNDGAIYSNGFGAGQGRKIEIEAENIELSNGGIIVSGANGSGEGANLSISVQNSFKISGKNENTSGVISVTRNIGDAGNVSIKADSLTISDGGFIYGDTDSIVYGKRQPIFQQKFGNWN
ncbi:MAG: hypothetical protein HC887_02870 [Desulfobacteraceae bacterium]|nr:hypothetical protein [Desulfobacteraceae bacterium]